jgi:hypothetical protein
LASCALGEPRKFAYAMSVGSVPIAELALEFACADGFARVSMEVRNQGLATLLSGRNTTQMTALVDFDDAAVPRPNEFRARYEKPDRVRETELDFGPDGTLVHLETRNQGRLQESPVPEEQREPSIDPLATLLRLSDWLARGPGAGEILVFPVFEGRKRADLEAIYRGQAEVSVAGTSRQAHRLEVALEGVSGFEPEDSFVTMPGEPREWLDCYASREAPPMPLLIAGSGRLPTRIELMRG